MLGTHIYVMDYRYVKKKNNPQYSGYSWVKEG